MNVTAHADHRPRAAWRTTIGGRLWEWCAGLRAGGAAPASIDPRLRAVRQDFYAALRDIRNLHADRAVTRLMAARAARDLWHLRAEVFTAVAVQLGETEARARVQCLNRHFPTRAPLSGFAPLDGD